MSENSYRAKQIIFDRPRKFFSQRKSGKSFAMICRRKRKGRMVWNEAAVMFWSRIPCAVQPPVMCAGGREGFQRMLIRMHF